MNYFSTNHLRMSITKKPIMESLIVWDYHQKAYVCPQLRNTEKGKTRVWQVWWKPILDETPGFGDEEQLKNYTPQHDSLGRLLTQTYTVTQKEPEETNSSITFKKFIQDTVSKISARITKHARDMLEPTTTDLLPSYRNEALTNKALTIQGNAICLAPPSARRVDIGLYEPGTPDKWLAKIPDDAAIVVMEKWDGMCGTIYKDSPTTPLDWRSKRSSRGALWRKSMPTLTAFMDAHLATLPPELFPVTVHGEIFIPNTPASKISGMVRRAKITPEHLEKEKEIMYIPFEFVPAIHREKKWSERMQMLRLKYDILAYVTKNIVNATVRELILGQTQVKREGVIVRVDKSFDPKEPLLWKFKRQITEPMKLISVVADRTKKQVTHVATVERDGVQCNARLAGTMEQREALMNDASRIGTMVPVTYAELTSKDKKCKDAILNCNNLN